MLLPKTGFVQFGFILRSGMNLRKFLFAACISLLSFLGLPGCQQAKVAPTFTPARTITTQVQSNTPTVKDQYVSNRQAMVNTIRAYGVKDEDVLRVMQKVPRHAFVPETELDQAYDDHPLPIGYGQTISQPFIVAWMTELLELKSGSRVLEIGTGSGYQAAVLAEMGYDTYSIEIVPELADSAAARLQQLGYMDIHLKQDDGYYGWKEYAPYDAIIVTAAPDHLPAPLAAQLSQDGCIVIPIGPQGSYQTLWRFVNEADGLKAYNLGEVSFVPFSGGGIINEGNAP